MSGGWQSEIARRPLLAGLLGVLGIGAAGGLVYEVPRLMRPRYKRTKYDDLLSQLDDRDNAVKLGAAYLAQAAQFDPTAAAEALRHGEGKGSVARAVGADIAEGRLVQVHGWLLPESLVRIAGIAAKVR